MGTLIGQVLVGMIADQLGRKFTFVATMVLVIIGTHLPLFCSSLQCNISFLVQCFVALHKGLWQSLARLYSLLFLVISLDDIVASSLSPIPGTLGSCLLSWNAFGIISVFFCIGVWRLILGVGIGGEYPLTAIITSEASADEMNRGTQIAAVFSLQGNVVATFISLLDLHPLITIILLRVGEAVSPLGSFLFTYFPERQT